MSAQPVFNPKTVIGMIAAGILAFAAMLLLIAYGGNIRSGSDGGAHPLSVAATGFKGLVTLVGEYHDTGLVREEADERDDLLIVVIEERTEPERITDLLERRGNLPTLFVLPKWATVRDPARRGWVRALGPFVGTAAEPALEGIEVAVQSARGRSTAPGPAAAEGVDILAGLRLPVPASAQTISGKGLTPLASVPGGGALVARMSEEPHYIVADPDLLNNHGLRDPARALAALQLVERLNGSGEGVDFDLGANGPAGAASRNVLRLAFEPPFLAMTLALFVAALLAGLHGAFRFGPVLREARSIAFGKAALVENSAGLLRLAEREVRLGAAYADVVRHETARTTGAPPALQGDRLDAYLNRLGRSGQPGFSELAAQLDHVRDRHGLMAAARALYQWKKEIIR